MLTVGEYTYTTDERSVSQSVGVAQGDLSAQRGGPFVDIDFRAPPFQPVKQRNPSHQNVVAAGLIVRPAAAGDY